jgi:hypothetical protein
MDYLYVPVDHVDDLNLTELQTFLAWAHREEAAGRPMYVHCTNGWHRAAAFAMAWEMDRRHEPLDEAAAEVAARRPGTEVRAPGALLQLQAQLTGGDPLRVILEADAPRPPANGAMPVRVLAVADGKPLAGASVQLSTESGRVEERATTGADGVAAFSFAAPTDGSFMDYLTARASAPGFVDGADTVEVFYGIDVPAPSGLAAKATVDAGRLRVDVSKGGGPLHARVLATSGSWSAIESTPDATAWLPLPPTAGSVQITVESWGAAPAATTVDAPAAPAGTTVAPATTAAPTAPPPSPTSADASAPPPTAAPAAPAPAPPPAHASSDGALLQAGLVALLGTAGVAVLALGGRAALARRR